MIDLNSTPFSLRGKNAVITGGATGLGLGIAKAMTALGARVVICSRNEENLKQAVGQLGASASYRVYDVLDFAEAENFIDSIDAEMPIDILVNNAGAHLKKRSEDVAVEEFQHILNVHLVGAHALTTAAGEKMMARNSGSIVYIASMASIFGIPYVTAYSAAKAGMLGVVRTLAVEWGSRGIRINAVAPGWIESNMMRNALNNDPDRKNKILGRTPLNAFGESEDIGNVVAFLSSDAARFITGVCLPVDGGASIGF